MQMTFEHAAPCASKSKFQQCVLRLKEPDLISIKIRNALARGTSCFFMSRDSSKVKSEGGCGGGVGRETLASKNDRTKNRMCIDRGPR